MPADRMWPEARLYRMIGEGVLEAKKLGRPDSDPGLQPAISDCERADAWGTGPVGSGVL